MVALAQNWTSVGPQHQCVLTMLSEPRDIGSRLLFSKTLDSCWGRPEYVNSLEHVQARLTLSYNHRGNLAIHLISPLGTRSTLLAPRYTHTHTYCRNTKESSSTSYQSDRYIILQVNINMFTEKHSAVFDVFNLCLLEVLCIFSSRSGRYCF